VPRRRPALCPPRVAGEPASIPIRRTRKGAVGFRPANRLVEAIRPAIPPAKRNIRYNLRLSKPGPPARLPPVLSVSRGRTLSSARGGLAAISAGAFACPRLPAIPYPQSAPREVRRSLPTRGRGPIGIGSECAPRVRSGAGGFCLQPRVIVLEWNCAPEGGSVWRRRAYGYAQGYGGLWMPNSSCS